MSRTALSDSFSTSFSSSFLSSSFLLRRRGLPRLLLSLLAAVATDATDATDAVELRRLDAEGESRLAPSPPRKPRRLEGGEPLRAPMASIGTSARLLLPRGRAEEPQRFQLG